MRKSLLVCTVLSIALKTYAAEGYDNDYRFLYESGNYSGTIAHISPLLESDPDNHILWYYLARSRQHLMQYDEAVRAFYNVYDIDSTYLPVYFHLGRIYTETGAFDTAIELLEHAHSLDRENATILYFLAGAYEATRDIPDAVKKYRLVLDLNSDRTEAYYYLASVFDEHYADRNVLKEYYQIFLQKAGERYPELVRQALKRIEAIREEMFFDRGGLHCNATLQSRECEIYLQSIRCARPQPHSLPVVSRYIVTRFSRVANKQYQMMDTTCVLVRVVGGGVHRVVDSRTGGGHLAIALAFA